MIETHSITKVFTGKKWKVEALKDIDFKAERGKLTALVGPNGAGKTTLLKIISTLILPTSGSAYVDGYDVVSQPNDVRKHLGLVTVSDRLLYYRLSGMENLLFYGSLYDMSIKEAKNRAYGLLDLVGLKEWADEPTMHYSTGMLRRLAIARALMHDPDVILLDEPTLGVDVASARKVRQLVRKLSMDRTIVLTSHFMHEIEELADVIYILKNGKIIARGSPEDIINMAGKIVEAKLSAIIPSLERFITRYENGYAVIRGPKPLVEQFTPDYYEITPSLEDAYIALAGENEQDFRPYQFKRGGAWARERPV